METGLSRYSAIFEHAARTFIAGKLSPHTRTAYATDLERWLKFCYATGVKPEMATLEVTTVFRDYLMRTFANVTTRRILAALSSIYRALHRNTPPVVQVNPFHSGLLAWPPGSNEGKTQAVSDKTSLAMIQHAQDDLNRMYGLRDAAVLSLLFDTGLRRASVAGIKRALLIEHEGMMSFRTFVKGAKEATIRIPEVTAQAVRKWLQVAPESPFLFPSMTKTGQMSIDTVNKIVNSRAAAVGMKGVHPHCFRAAYITAAYDQGIAERDIQESVHHSDPKTTRRYDRGERGLEVAAQLADKRRRK